MIKWLSYTRESLQRAEIENKPIFLHIIAKWSAYCEKMEKEILQDPDISEIINRDFIPILVNRDERPDLDSIYQKASYIIGQATGWPLNLFLCPDGKPFAGVIYKANEHKDYFTTMLKKALEIFHTNEEKVSKRAQVIIDAIKPIEIAPSPIREELIQNPEEDIVKEIDYEYGGFKKTPKFAPFAHMDLLLWKYWIKPKPWVLDAIKKTFEGMLQGGIYDHIEGGFHRYCTDKEWKLPQFEKLAVDNAWHIINFSYAYTILKRELFREIVTEITNYFKENLLIDKGYFAASQFGDSFYYTWTEKELMKISPLTMTLVDEKAKINDRFILIGREREILKQLREEFLSERKKRPLPPIDSELYANVNGICAEAFILGWRITKNKELLDIALKALDITLRELFKNGDFYRTPHGTKALIDDYAYVISALISAYEVTGQDLYLQIAVRLLDLALEKLWDQKNGGFYEGEDSVLEIRNKNIHDTSYPSSNSIMIINLLKLYGILKNSKLLSFAEASLKAFSNSVSAYLSPYYIKALLSYFDMLVLNFYTTLDSPLGKAAIEKITPFTVFAHRERSKDYIIPSVGEKIFEPITNSDDLSKFLRI